jgi:hypothetical protein
MTMTMTIIMVMFIIIIPMRNVMKIKRAYQLIATLLTRVVLTHARTGALAWRHSCLPQLPPWLLSRTPRRNSAQLSGDLWCHMPRRSDSVVYMESTRKESHQGGIGFKDVGIPAQRYDRCRSAEVRIAFVASWGWFNAYIPHPAKLLDNS